MGRVILPKGAVDVAEMEANRVREPIVYISPGSHQLSLVVTLFQWEMGPLRLELLDNLRARPSAILVRRSWHYQYPRAPSSGELISPSIITARAVSHRIVSARTGEAKATMIEAPCPPNSDAPQTTATPGALLCVP